MVAGIRENTLHLAWLGDSQAGLVRNGQHVTVCSNSFTWLVQYVANILSILKLMQPHKPEREDEKKRIEDLGGCVIWFGTWRVNGSLSVSRSIGTFCCFHRDSL